LGFGHNMDQFVGHLRGIGIEKPDPEIAAQSVQLAN
jgi:hypothetical protein